jgi:predicted acyltransferase
MALWLFCNSVLSAMSYLSSDHHLLVYWALMTLIRVPGLGYASLEPETNLGAWLDYKLLKGHLWSASKVWDPEGLLSTLPACGTGIIGVLTGLAIKRPDPLREKVNRIFFYGAILLCIGYFWNMVFPFNKKIWTSSFVVFTGGLGLMVLASLIYIIDIKKMDRWTHHFLYFGMNSMMVFVGSGLVARLMGLISWMHQGTKMTLKGYLYQGLKQSGLDQKFLLCYSRLVCWVCSMFYCVGCIINEYFVSSDRAENREVDA